MKAGWYCTNSSGGQEWFPWPRGANPQLTPTLMLGPSAHSLELIAGSPCLFQVKDRSSSQGCGSNGKAYLLTSRQTSDLSIRAKLHRQSEVIQVPLDLFGCEGPEIKA